MGEVWRGRDTRLDRSVAVKVLPPAFAEDEDRKRFEREAKAISSLNHPHICTLFDVSRDGESHFLVMELLEGESLADRLQRGPLPLDQVVKVGAQVAEALDAAHRQGVVHRDLKPGNVTLTKAGAKLLDFGLARTGVAGDAVSGSTEMATEAKPLTTAGTVLGTFQYMAPEQLEGRDADARTDIFALGALLYEMATGRRAFDGKSRTSLIAAILASQPPPISSVQPVMPPALDHVVRRCLEKDPEDRWQSARDVASELRWIAEAGSQVGVPVPVAQHRKHRERLAWGVAGALLLTSVALAVGFVRRAPAPPRVVRFDLPQPAQLAATGAPKISPDGRQIAFVGTDEQGRNQIWLRALESLEARPLSGTEGVTNGVRPFWSPDSRFLAYFVGSRLMKIPVDGGPPQKIADTEVTGGDGTWSEQGVILFDGSTGDPIRRVDAAGGVSRVERAGGEGEGAYEVAWPQFLPDGEHYLFIAFGGAPDANGVWLARLDDTTPRKVVDGLSRVELAPPDLLLFVRESTLVAQRFDPGDGTLVGEPVPVAEGLGVSNVGLADFSASQNGVLVYRAGQDNSDRLGWLDLKGSPVAGGEDPGIGRNPALSADGRWLAVDRLDGKDQDIWLRDLKRGVSSRFTTDAKGEYAPLFTPDGRSLLFSREEGDGWAVVEKSLDSPGERVLLSPADRQMAIAVTPDGTRLLYAVRGKSKGGPQFDLGVVDLAAGGEGKLYAASEFSEFRGAFSPDGRWLAYQSTESGRGEIYVQAFPEPGRKWQVSTQGGAFPIWSPDGATLYYVAADRKLMRVEVSTSPGFDAGVPEALSPVPLAAIAARNLLVAAPDGQRFLGVLAAGNATATPTTVVLEWDAALRR
jgi:eukaryotic-like serine/threonine-protein kinase